MSAQFNKEARLKEVSVKLDEWISENPSAQIIPPEDSVVSSPEKET